MTYALPQAWYIHAGDGATTGYYAIPQYSNKAWTAGQLVRPLTPPAVGNERAYVCTTAGTSTGEPTWTFTKGAAQTATGGVVFTECTGEPGVNGDLTNCLQWTASSNALLGRVIYDPTSNALHIAITNNLAGAASKPTFQTGLGGNTTDGSTHWINIGPPSSWPVFAAPIARLLNAFTVNWGAAGNDFYVADNSVDQFSATTFYNFGTIPLGSRVFSVDHTASLPATASTLKAGATILSSATASNGFSIGTSAGTNLYFYGFTFSSNATTAVSLISVGIGTGANVRFENCKFQLASGSVSGASITMGSLSTTDLVNCTFGFNNVGQFVQWGGTTTWRNTPDPCITGTIPTIPFRVVVNGPGAILFEGIDFNSIVSNTMFSNAVGGASVTIKNCKVGGTIIGAAAAGMAALQIDVVSSDSGVSASSTRNERYRIDGNMFTSSGAGGWRTGGATDSGVGIAHVIQSTSFARQWRPFTSLPLIIWNNTVGSPVIVTFYGLSVGGGAALPFNDQFWFDVEYMGDTGSPLVSVASCGMASPLSTHSVVAVTDASNWNLVTTPQFPFTLSVTITPQQKGYLTIYPKIGAPGSGYYLDPKPVLH